MYSNRNIVLELFSSQVPPLLCTKSYYIDYPRNVRVMLNLHRVVCNVIFAICVESDIHGVRSVLPTIGIFPKRR